MSYLWLIFEFIWIKHRIWKRKTMQKLSILMELTVILHLKIGNKIQPFLVRTRIVCANTEEELWVPPYLDRELACKVFFINRIFWIVAERLFQNRFIQLIFSKVQDIFCQICALLTKSISINRWICLSKTVQFLKLYLNRTLELDIKIAHY